MKRWLLLLLFAFPRFGFGQADPAPAAGLRSPICGALSRAS